MELFASQMSQVSDGKKDRIATKLGSAVQQAALFQGTL